MATVESFKADLAKAQAAFVALKSRVEADTANFKAQIQALKDQIGSGVVLSQADLDTLDASVNALAADIGTIDPDPSNPAPQA